MVLELRFYVWTCVHTMMTPISINSQQCMCNNKFVYSIVRADMLYKLNMY